jgi:hypothetical protein
MHIHSAHPGIKTNTQTTPTPIRSRVSSPHPHELELAKYPGSHQSRKTLNNSSNQPSNSMAPMLMNTKNSTIAKPQTLKYKPAPYADIHRIFQE